jgi:hypothetical protein
MPKGNVVHLCHQFSKTFLDCLACFRQVSCMFCFHCSFTPTSTLGDVNTLVSMVDQHLLVNLTAEFKFLTTVFYCTTRMAVDFEMMLSLALRRTLRSGPTQLINESIIKILLMIPFYENGRRDYFFIWLQHLKICFFWTTGLCFILQTPGSFNQYVFLCIHC